MSHGLPKPLVEEGELSTLVRTPSAPKNGQETPERPSDSGPPASIVVT